MMLLSCAALGFAASYLCGNRRLGCGDFLRCFTLERDSEHGLFEVEVVVAGEAFVALCGVLPLER